METACPLCGAALDEPAVEPLGGSVQTCPSCGARVESRRVAPEHVESGSDTVFQPRLLNDGAEDPGSGTVAVAPGMPETGRSFSTAASSPPAGPEAFFMVLGAPAGQERIPLRSACTVFGRSGCEVDLADAAIADRQFQVEVMGREFFLRDLGSARPTQLNGRPVRYTELLPGDQVSVGRMVLVFRTADDGVSRRTP